MNLLSGEEHSLPGVRETRAFARVERQLPDEEAQPRFRRVKTLGAKFREGVFAKINCQEVRRGVHMFTGGVKLGIQAKLAI